jgi:hypothetical protein
VVIVPADRQRLDGPPPRHGRTTFNGTALVAVDLDAVGIPSKRIRAALLARR